MAEFPQHSNLFYKEAWFFEIVKKKALSLGRSAGHLGRNDYSDMTKAGEEEKIGQTEDPAVLRG